MPLRPLPRPKIPRVGRPSGKFTQHRRIDFLREKLEAHTVGLTLDELASMLRVTTRSVRRYLKELALVTELESIAVRRGGVHVWRIKPSERGRTVTLRRTQAYALLAPRRVFDALKGSALYDEIDVALREVGLVARRPAVRPGVRGEPASDAHLEDRFVYVPPAPRGYGNRSEDVDEAFRAVAELRALRFRYAEEGKDAAVAVHPYALVMHGGAITCIAREWTGDGTLPRSGHDVDWARATRTFAFERMSELAASEGERFELPAEFDVGDWLQGDFGVARGGRVVRVMVEFDPRVAEVVRARRVHPSQKVAVAADGRVRASMSVPEAREVMDRLRSWLLGFGAAARVIEPRELADEIARELRRAAARYGAS